MVFHDTTLLFKKGSFFFVFGYGITMSMTIAWNMTALNTSPILIATISIYSL